MVAYIFDNLEFDGLRVGAAQIYWSEPTYIVRAVSKLFEKFQGFMIILCSFLYSRKFKRFFQIINEIQKTIP